MTGERFRRLFLHSPVGLVVTDASDRLVACNPAFARLLGWDDPDQLAGDRLDDHRAPTGDTESEILIQEELQAGRVPDPRDVRFRHRDGSPVWALEQQARLPGDPVEGAVLHTVVDIDARKEEEWGLAEMAYHDALTGLANRRLLDIQAPQILAIAERREGRAALFFLDLVDFKDVNNVFGHRDGDRALTCVADRLRENLRSADISCRTGGDEFAVLLGEVEDAAGATQGAERLRRAIVEPIELSDGEVALDARFGVAVYPEDGNDLDSLFNKADEALTRAKAEGARIVRIVP